MVNLFERFAATGTCHTHILNFPTWHAYLAHNADCSIRLAGLNDIWLVVAAVVEILLQIGALAAVGYIMWAGFDYITSQGEPDKTARARSAIINALVGLVITVLAASIVNLIATQVS